MLTGAGPVASYGGAVELLAYFRSTRIWVR